MAYSMTPSADADSSPPPLARFFGGSSALDAFARLTGFRRRKPRKITPAVFLTAFIHAVLSPACSMRDIAIRAGLAANTTISRQGLWKRINQGALDLLTGCLARVLAGVPEVTGAALEYLPAGIRRVLVADSTVIPLHPSLAAFFPGASNQACSGQAAARVQAVLDLVTGRFVEFRLGSFRDNDQKAAAWMPGLLRAGDLILRDLGYFTLASLREIAEIGAFFVTRLRLDTSLFREDGTPLDLLAELRAATGDVHEIPVLAGAAVKLPVRMVAVRLGSQEAAERRGKAKANRDKRLKWTEKRAELLGWSITLDNLPAELPAKQVYPIYALRWRVEIVFKSWKSHLGMRRPLAGPAGAKQARATLFAFLIAAALAASCHAWLVARDKAGGSDGGVPDLSLLKTVPLIAEMLAALTLPAAHDPAELLRQIGYHCRYEKRKKRQNFMEAMRSAFFDPSRSLS
jgi:hypothetical protein